MPEIDAEFEKTSKILFGKSLGHISNYAGWLERNTPGARMVKSVRGGKSVLMPNFSIFRLIPDNLVLDYESTGINLERKLELSDDFFVLAKRAKGKYLLVCEFREGENRDVAESNFYKNNVNTFKIVCCFNSKNCAYNIWSSFNENTFGCYRNMYGMFCINCYYSTELKRCFEMDACNRCSDCLFCHNVENCQDCMFCFNAKNKKYAIGNVEVGREKYMEVKQKILTQIADELEKTHSLKYDIYNVGSVGKK